MTQAEADLIDVLVGEAADAERASVEALATAIEQLSGTPLGFVRLGDDTASPGVMACSGRWAEYGVSELEAAWALLERLQED